MSSPPRSTLPLTNKRRGERTPACLALSLSLSLFIHVRLVSSSNQWLRRRHQPSTSDNNGGFKFSGRKFSVIKVFIFKNLLSTHVNKLCSDSQQEKHFSLSLSRHFNQLIERICLVSKQRTCEDPRTLCLAAGGGSPLFLCFVYIIESSCGGFFL